MSNEMEDYEERMRKGGVDLQPEPDDENSNSRDDNSGSTGVGEGLSKKKKQMVTFGIGGGLIFLVIVFILMRFSSAPPPTEEFLASVPQSTPSTEMTESDTGGVVAHGGADPMVFGDEGKKSGQPSVPAGNPEPVINPIPASKAGDGFGSGASVPEVIPPAKTTPSATPAHPTVASSVAPPVYTPGPTHPPAVPVVQQAKQVTKVESSEKEIPAAPTAARGPDPILVDVQARALKNESKAKDLEVQLESLKRVVASFQEKEKAREQLAQKAAMNPASAPSVAATKPQVQPVAAQKPTVQQVAKKAPQATTTVQRPQAAPTKGVETAANAPMTVKAEDLKGVITKSGAKVSQSKIRSDFSVYAVTDGRVWVVDKDGERLGPLAIGSPLTDGSKITGIDVARGAVITSAGEIQ